MINAFFKTLPDGYFKDTAKFPDMLVHERNQFIQEAEEEDQIEEMEEIVKVMMGEVQKQSR